MNSNETDRAESAFYAGIGLAGGAALGYVLTAIADPSRFMQFVGGISSAALALALLSLIVGVRAMLRAGA